jgi:hypothetical protein
MASKHTIKEAWEEDDRLLMSLYGMDLNHPEIGLPTFGSGVRMEGLPDARVEMFRSAMGEVGSAALSKHGKKIRESSTLPTILNLAWHFRYISGSGIELLRTVAEQYPGPTTSFTRLLLQAGEDQFFHERVGPLRDYLEWKWQVYFYSIPATSYETRLVGGKGWQPEGPLILCLLPKFPQIALDRGEHEAKLRQFAGQVLWLVRGKLCINCKTAEATQDLIKVITAWKNYVSTYYLLGELDKMEQNNPFFLTEKVRRQLLPEAAFDLLRLPGETRENA